MEEEMGANGVGVTVHRMTQVHFCFRGYLPRLCMHTAKK